MTAPAVTLTRHTFVVSGEVVHEVTAKAPGAYVTRCRVRVSDKLPTIVGAPIGVFYCCAACFVPQKVNAR